MRPDAVNWTEKKGHVGLAFVPRRRMHRALWRVIALVLGAQVAASMLILLFLQGPWRRGARIDHAATIAQLAADQFHGQAVSTDDRAAKRLLDQIVAKPGVSFAVIVDSMDRVILASASDSGWEAYKQANRSGLPRMAGASPSGPVDAHGNTLIFGAYVRAADGSAGHRLLMGVRDRAATRAAVDGAIALAGGLILVAGGLMPFVCMRLRRWTRGLADLHTAIHRLERGASPKPAPVGGEDEIAYLLVAFNDMAGKLLGSRRELLAANEDLERRVAQRTDELRSANQELEHKNEELAELTDTALRFTDDVAHEFRTPLAVISEFASITADGLGGEVTEKQAEFLQFIVDASKDLATLVDDFLDSGKLRARSLRVERSAHAVEDLIESTWPILETRAASRKITLESRIEPGLPPVYADIDKARRTLVNVVMNAIKFSRANDTVIVSARPDSGGVRISITDHGPGLTTEELQHLFHRFRQGGEGRRSSAKGFGLGLNIVQDLVAINLGQVSVESKPREGSTFSFTLPPAEPAKVVEWYVARTLERNPDGMLSVLRAESDAIEIDELQSFIASATYPTDIQLRSADGRALILIGEAAHAERWRAKLFEQARDSHHFTDENTGARIRVSHVGSWPARDAKEAIPPIVTDTIITEVSRHGESPRETCCA